MISKLPKNISLDHVDIELHPDFVITTIKEGLAFNGEHLKNIFDLFDSYYGDRLFISIANRKFDYTIDPNLLKSSKHKNLVGIAVCCYSEASYEISQFEKNFYDGPFEVFYSIEECKQWGIEVLKIKKADL